MAYHNGRELTAEEIAELAAGNSAGLLARTAEVRYVNPRTVDRGVDEPSRSGVAPKASTVPRGPGGRSKIDPESEEGQRQAREREEWIRDAHQAAVEAAGSEEALQELQLQNRAKADKARADLEALRLSRMPKSRRRGA